MWLTGLQSICFAVRPLHRAFCQPYGPLFGGFGLSSLARLRFLVFHTDDHILRVEVIWRAICFPYFSTRCPGSGCCCGLGSPFPTVKNSRGRLPKILIGHPLWHFLKLISAKSITSDDDKVSIRFKINGLFWDNELSECLLSLASVFFFFTIIYILL